MLTYRPLAINVKGGCADAQSVSNLSPMPSVHGWKAGVPEPFGSDGDFWRSVGASVDAFLGFALALIVTLVLGPWAALSFALPVALLMRAALTGKRSAARTRTTFATVAEWRLAERQAVASVLPRALIRARWLPSGRN